MRERAVVRALFTSAAAIALVAASGAGVAVAEPFDTLTFPTPDLAYGHLGCTTTVTKYRLLNPVWRTAATEEAAGFARIDLGEYGSMRVQSTGCGPVTWIAHVGILDEAPPHPRVWTMKPGATGNPASAAASQTVLYGIGEREAGQITFTFLAKSRLGELCLGEKHAFDAVTAAPTLVAVFECAPELLRQQIGG